MLDRPARAELIRTISEYLGDGMTAIAFDERINEIADETEDKTVRDVVSALWFYYDDCRDHPVVLTKEEWNYFQRLISSWRLIPRFMPHRLDAGQVIRLSRWPRSPASEFSFWDFVSTIGWSPSPSALFRWLFHLRPDALRDNSAT